MNAPITSPTMAQRQLPSTAAATTASVTQGFAPPPPPSQKAPSTDAFIQNLNLVAEAAKRAQMAEPLDAQPRFRAEPCRSTGQADWVLSLLLCATLRTLAPDIGVFWGSRSHGVADIMTLGVFVFPPHSPTNKSSNHAARNFGNELQLLRHNPETCLKALISIVVIIYSTKVEDRKRHEKS
ncbi:hypothetical protein F5Y11DRAFT_364242 [Daldinia sp. FL1419]|nr:hypothetical protein F5Y11DRAFT_364242 [Daldinia sp. FL1419]